MCVPCVFLNMCVPCVQKVRGLCETVLLLPIGGIAAYKTASREAYMLQPTASAYCQAIEFELEDPLT